MRNWTGVPNNPLGECISALTSILLIGRNETQTMKVSEVQKNTWPRWHSSLYRHYSNYLFSRQNNVFLRFRMAIGWKNIEWSLIPLFIHIQAVLLNYGFLNTTTECIRKIPIKNVWYAVILCKQSAILSFPFK